MNPLRKQEFSLQSAPLPLVSGLPTCAPDTGIVSLHNSMSQFFKISFHFPLHVYYYYYYWYIYYWFLRRTLTITMVYPIVQLPHCPDRGRNKMLICNNSLIQGHHNFSHESEFKRWRGPALNWHS